VARSAFAHPEAWDYENMTVLNAPHWDGTNSVNAGMFLHSHSVYAWHMLNLLSGPIAFANPGTPAHGPIRREVRDAAGNIAQTVSTP